MKKIIILILSVILLAGCNKKDSFLVKGNINGTTRKSIIINRIDVNNIQFVDSAKISSKGSFRIRIPATEPDFYQVGFSSANFMTLLALPGEKITVNFRGENLFKDYTVEGSMGSELVRMLDYKLLDTRRKIDSLNSVYREASLKPGFDTVQERLTGEILDIVKAQRKFNIEFIVSHINSFASVKALYQKLNDETYVLYETRDLQYFKIVSDSLKYHYPGSRHTKALLRTVDDGIKQINAMRLNQLISTLPETKLDPVLKDINGRTIALSSLRGKYVLLTFWSSESRDCVVENLQLKEYYRLYKAKGFEIYQISLDTDEAKWKTAVAFDELPWISAREENPQNPKNANLFNVKSVPANFLFDPQSNVIASNLHGRNLQLKLSQIFAN